MLTCQEFVELATDYLEGAVPPHRHREVREHLADCVDCLRYLGQVQLTTRLLARLAVGPGVDSAGDGLGR